MTEWTQPDGVVVSFYQAADFELRLISQGIDGYTIVQDKKTKFLCWAVQSEDGHDIVSSGYPIHLFEPVELGIDRFVRRSPELMQKIRERMQVLNNLKTKIETVSYTQPDRTIINVRRLEVQSLYVWYIAQDFYTVILDTKTGFWCWAIQSDNGHDIESSGYPIHLYDPEDLEIDRRIFFSQEKIDSMLDELIRERN
jgi:hypothetical protein